MHIKIISERSVHYVEVISAANPEMIENGTDENTKYFFDQEHDLNFPLHTDRQINKHKT